ncbi:MAG TPA: hypothetical protein VFO93_16215 [Hymenobacter sp.]|uniref:hypothetical protein n=1 Tax=Hymenobacter sp. TaxID=1898978 RepID=UPI002D7E4C6A|nr:hypothetical protein [Hymenobacter sp.]HET9505089.1 hypothetical protein [Hymenobacter sp.]
MLRSLCLPLLGLALLAQAAVAQTTPTKKPARTTRFAARAARAGQPPATRNASPLASTNDNAKGQAQSGYAAPGQPIQDPRYNGKNTPPYDGAAAPAKRNTTLGTPKQ